MRTVQQTKTPTRFAGNGLSRTAMLYKIDSMAGHKLTVPEMNRIRDVNPRQLEHVDEHLITTASSAGDAMFALRLILKR